MSSVVDNKVVEMQFDNSKFEKNVDTSINTIEKLKQSLDFGEQAATFDEVEKAANDVNLSGIASAVESLQDRFSTFGIIGMEAIQKITDKVIDLASSFTSFLTSGVISGGITRAMNLQDAQFTLQGLLNDESEVEAVMQNVNDAVDGTAYSLDQAALVASQLVASGFTAGDELESSLRAVAGVAAMTNSEYSEIGHIFTTISGNGRLMTEQLNELANRGLNAAATIGNYLGVSEAEVREMTTKGEIDFQTFADAMDDAFGEHAKEANTTFRGSMSNIKAAMSRIGADFVTPLVEQNGVLVNLFNTFKDSLNETHTLMNESGSYAERFTGYFGDLIEKLTNWLANADIERTFGIFDNLLEGTINIFKAIKSVAEPVIEAFKNIIPLPTMDNIESFSESFKNLTEKLIISEDTANKLQTVFEGFFSIIKIGIDAVEALVGWFKDLITGGHDTESSFLDAASGVGEYITGVKDSIEQNGIFVTAISKLNDAFVIIVDTLKNAWESLKSFFSDNGISGFTTLLSKLWDILKNILNGIVDFFSRIGDSSFGGILEVGVFATLIYQLKNLTTSLKNFVNSIKPITGSISDCIGQLKSTLFSLQNELKAESLMKLAEAILILAAALVVLSTVDSDGVAQAAAAIGILLGEMVAAMAALQSFTTVSEGLFGKNGALSNLIDTYAAQRMYNSMVKVAAAIAILAVACKLLSTIDGTSLLESVAAVGVMMGELSAAMIALNKWGGKVKGTTTLIALAAAIDILASAVKKLADLSWQEMCVGLGSVTVLVGEVTASMILLNKYGSGSKFKGIVVMLSLAEAVNILSSAVIELAELSWEEMAKGLTSVTILVGEVDASMLLLNNYGSGSTYKGIFTLLSLAEAIKILGSAVIDLAELSWEQMAKGLASTTTLIVELDASMLLLNNKCSGSQFKGIVTMLALAEAVKMLGTAVTSLSSMTWSEVAKGLGSVTVLIGELVGTCALLKAMGGTSGAASLIALAAALDLLCPVLKTLAGMSLADLAVSLGALATSLAILGAAAALISGSNLIMIGAGMSLIGVGLAAIGAAVITVSIGLSALMGSIVVVAESVDEFCEVIVAGVSSVLQGIIQMIPDICTALVDALMQLVDLVAENAPTLIIEIAGILVDIFDGLAEYAPQLVRSLGNLIISVIEALVDLLPEFINAFMDVLGSLFAAIVEAFNNCDTESIIKGITMFGMAVVLVKLLKGLGAEIPAAMGSLAELAVFVAELGAIIAAFGAINAIPGIDWLVNKGGDLLIDIGRAIGGFVGGILGGILEGMASGLPGIATYLSEFMENLQPFLEGAAQIDEGMMAGVGMLADVILTLTAAEILDGLTSWITGGNTLSNFGEELAALGPSLKTYGEAVKGLDTDAVEASACAIQMIADAAKNLPNEGGVLGWFVGENSLSLFAEELPPFGEAMKSYSDNVRGIAPEAVEASCEAAECISAFAENLPNQGGFVSWFTGDNSLSVFAYELIEFGKAMKSYSESIDGFDPEAVKESADAAQTIADFAETLPDQGGWTAYFTGNNTLSYFGWELAAFGPSLKSYSDSIKGIDATAIITSAVIGELLSALAASLPAQGGIISWFTGDNTLSGFGKELVKFAPLIVDYCNTINDASIDVTAVRRSVNAAEILFELAENLPSDTSLLEKWLTGGKMSLSKLAEELPPFADAMVSYCGSLAEGSIDVTAVKRSANAAKALFELFDYLPEQDDKFKQWMGNSTMDMAYVGAELAVFAPKIADYAENIGEFDDTFVVKSADAAKALFELFNYLPEQDDKFKQWMGNTTMSLVEVGKELVEFAPKIVQYANKIGEFDDSYVVASANAAASLFEFVGGLPEQDDIFNQWFGSGRNVSIVTVASQMMNLAPYLQKYSDAISGFDANTVEASINAAKSIFEFIGNLPKQDQIFEDWFTSSGVDTLADCVYTMSNVGKHLKEYSDNVKGFSESDVTASLNAVQTMFEFIAGLPEQTKIFESWFKEGTGDLRITSVLATMVNAGEHLHNYADNIAGINESDVQASLNCASMIFEFVDNLPEKNSNLVAWITGEDFSLEQFGEELEKFAPSFVIFAGSLEDVSQGSVQRVATVCSALTKLNEGLPIEGGLFSGIFGSKTSVVDFGTKLESFGDSIATFAGKLEEIAIENFDKALYSVSRLVGLANDANSIDTENFKKFGDSLEHLANVGIDGFVSAFTDAYDMCEQAAEDMVNNFLDVFDTYDELENFKEAGEGLVDKFMEGISGSQDDSDETWIDLMNSGVEKVTDYDDDFETEGHNLVWQLSKGIDNRIYELENSAERVTDNALQAVRNFHQDFITAGEYLMNGFIKGMDNNSGAVYNKAASVAQQAVNAIQNTLDEHSPSKVAEELGGENFAGTFAESIGEYGEEAYKASANVADMARKGLLAAIVRLNQLIETNLDTEPVITPVLDTRAINAQTLAMNQLFKTTAAGIALVGVTASTVSGEIQNDSNYDSIISEMENMRSDMRTVANEIEQLKVVMDTGTLVGQLVGPMDEALGRRAILEGRGV